jgi:hypothetical protein
LRNAFAGEKISRETEPVGRERLVLQCSIQIILLDNLNMTVRKRNYAVRLVLSSMKTSDPFQHGVGGLTKNSRIDWLPIKFQIPLSSQDAIHVGGGIQI